MAKPSNINAAPEGFPGSRPGTERRCMACGTISGILLLTLGACSWLIFGPTVYNAIIAQNFVTSPVRRSLSARRKLAPVRGVPIDAHEPLPPPWVVPTRPPRRVAQDSPGYAAFAASWTGVGDEVPQYEFFYFYNLVNVRRAAAHLPRARRMKMQAIDPCG